MSRGKESEGEALPAFDVAVERFQAFLEEQGRPPELVWVFREDFYSPVLGRTFCRSPLPADSESTARAYYAASQERKFGICLSAQFEFEGRSAATLWSPNSNLDAQYARVEGLKFSVARSWGIADTVQSRWAWRLHRFRSAYRLNQRQGFDIPLRSALRAWIAFNEEKREETRSTPAS